MLLTSLEKLNTGSGRLIFDHTIFLSRRIHNVIIRIITITLQVFSEGEQIPYVFRLLLVARFLAIKEKFLVFRQNHI